MTDRPLGRAPLWTVQDLAWYLGVPVNTIYKWRVTGDGPPALKVGRHVRYREDDVNGWLTTLRDRSSQ